jgi:hypothetical protein
MGKYALPKPKRKQKKGKNMSKEEHRSMVVCVAEFGSLYKVSAWILLNGGYKFLQTKDYLKSYVAEKRADGGTTSLIGKDFWFEFERKATDEEEGIFEKTLISST